VLTAVSSKTPGVAKKTCEVDLKNTGAQRPGGGDRPGETWSFLGIIMGGRKASFFNILKPPYNWDIIGLTKNNRILKL
jgi:hypothetical protein